MSWLDPHNWIGFDIESSGDLPEFALQPWQDKAFLTGFATAQYDVNGKVVADAWPPLGKIVTMETDPRDEAFVAKLLEGAEYLLDRSIRRKHYLLGWNMAFDVSWLIKMGLRDKVMQAHFIDAMEMWKTLTRIPESDKTRANRKKYGLKFAVEEFFPQYAGYDEGVDLHDLSPAATKKRRKYNRMDAGLTFQLAKKFVSELSEPERADQRRALSIQMQSIPLVADQYITGMCVNREGLENLGGKLTCERIELKVLLEAHGLTETVLASPTQLRVKLFEEWGLPVIKKTPKGEPSTDKDSLYELSFMDDRIDMVKRYREIGNLKTKFVDNILASADYNSDGRTHPTAIISSTYTGRMTYASSVGKNKEKRQTGFATHQMKRAFDYRDNIVAPEGYGLLEWDAASQEFRWCAIESGDETMLALCAPGEDAHAYMGSQMSDWDYRKLQHAAAHGDEEAKMPRMAGKVGNLSCQFRIGPKSLLATARTNYQLDWDQQMADTVHATYHRSYRGVKRYWKRKIYEAKQCGYAETLAGRRVILEGNWHGANAWQLESSAINFPIQGVGADQKYLAMMLIKPLLTKYNGYFYLELHDGLYAIFPLPKLEKAGHEGRKILSNLPYKKAWGFEPPISLPWDLKMGTTWGNLEEVE